MTLIQSFFSIEKKELYEVIINLQCVQDLEYQYGIWWIVFSIIYIKSFTSLGIQNSVYSYSNVTTA